MQPSKIDAPQALGSKFPKLTAGEIKVDRIKAFWAALGPMGKILIVGIPLIILVGLGLTLARCGGGQTEELGAEPAGEAAVLDGSAAATPADMGMLPTMAPTSGCLQIPSDLPVKYQQLVDSGWVPTNRTPTNFCYSNAPLQGSMQMWTSEFLDGENSFWGFPVTAADLVIGTYSLPPGLAIIVANGRQLEVQVVDVGPCGGANGCPGGKEPRWQSHLLVATPAVFAALGISGETANVTIQSLVPPQ